MVDLYAGVLPAGLGGSEQGGDQSIESLPGCAEVDVRVTAVHGDPSDDGLDVVDLDGTLTQYAPDFHAELVEHAVVPDLLRDVTEEIANEVCHPAEPNALGLRRRREQNLEVHRQYLRQEAPRILGAQGWVLVLTGDDCEHSELAGCLENNGVDVAAVQTRPDEGGDEYVGVRPVRTQEQAGVFECCGAFAHRSTPAPLHEHSLQRVDDASQLRAL